MMKAPRLPRAAGLLFVDMPIHVAILCEYPTLNGGERSILACVEQFAADDVTVTFLAPALGPLCDELQRRSLRHLPYDLQTDAGRLSRDSAIRRLAGLLTDGVDLLHANSLAMGRLTGAAASRLGMPCTAHLRDIVKLSPSVIAELNCNAHLVAVSRAVRDFHVAQGLSAGRTSVIHNGIDTAVFGLHPRTNWLRRALDLPDSALVVAAIGQVCLRKAQDVFAAAAAQLAGALPEAHFVLIGARHSTKPESIAFETGIRRRFADAGLAARFHPLGERRDVVHILPEVDVLVHAARQEPFGRVLLEAAACGVPIVATDVGGTGEMLSDGVDALLVSADDPQAIATAVIRLAEDRRLARQLAGAARERVVEQFPIARSAARLLEVWRNVVGPVR